MIRRLAIVILFITVTLSGENNHRSDIAQKKGNEKMLSALASPNNQASPTNTSGAKDESPKWYASPEWWLVILGFPTLFFIGWQAWEMRSGGETTNRQMQHLINAERAWIQVPEIIMGQRLSFLTPVTNQFHIWLHPYIVNNGRTQARITKIVARAHILDKPEGSDTPKPPILPEVPDYKPAGMSFERNIIMSPKQGINWFNVPICVEDLERIKTREAFLYIYGRIDYVDISENKRQTKFCKLYWIPYGPSDSTLQEDFVESAVIPRAYTECT